MFGFWRRFRRSLLFLLFIAALFFLLRHFDFISISIDINKLSYVLAGLFVFYLVFDYWIIPKESITVSVKLRFVAPFFLETRYTFEFSISALSFKKGERKEIYNQSVIMKLLKSDHPNLQRYFLTLADEYTKVHTYSIRRLAPNAKMMVDVDKECIRQLELYEKTLLRNKGSEDK